MVITLGSVLKAGALNIAEAQFHSANKLPVEQPTVSNGCVVQR